MVLGTAGCHLSEPKPTRLTSVTLPTERVRSEQEDAVKRLDAEEKTIEVLDNEPRLSEQRVLMNRLLVFFTIHVEEHGRWEERTIYDPVDRYVGGNLRFTTVLREQNDIARRWLRELERIADAVDPDVKSFVRYAHGLMALKRVHLEIDERVVLPVLGRSTPDSGH